MEDAEVLKELYETIKQNSKADYAGIIEQRASYPYLYHLSQIRENLVSFLPFDKDMRVLECNPGVRGTDRKAARNDGRRDSACGE